MTQQDLEQMERAFLPRSKKTPADMPSPVQLRLIKHDEDRSLIEISMLEGPNRAVADVLKRLDAGRGSPNEPSNWLNAHLSLSWAMTDGSLSGNRAAPTRC